ncbi:MAG: hypothetical protein ABL909_08720 [Sphingopyxis sp.]
MTDLKPRLFANDAAVRRIGEGLLARTLPRDDWTHEAHLAACLWLLSERGDVDLPKELPGIIRRYNESVGGVNDDNQGYHETLTQLYIEAVREWMLQNAAIATRVVPSLVDCVNALLASPIADRAWPLRLYSPERLFSVDARRRYIMPDL